MSTGVSYFLGIRFFFCHMFTSLRSDFIGSHNKSMVNRGKERGGREASKYCFNRR